MHLQHFHNIQYSLQAPIHETAVSLALSATCEALG